MKILLTNDDGFDAPGLQALAEALSGLGELVVVAPHVHVSGCSHQATTHRPLELMPVGPGWFKLDGSPVDCARVGLLQVASDADWLIAGINAGGNLGADVYLSGTVAAAREACFLRKPAIAISQYIRQSPVAWDRSRDWAREVLAALLRHEAPAGGFWNVNLPDPSGSVLPRQSFCPLDTNPLPVHFVAHEGKLHYRGSYHDRSRTAGHDVDVCFQGDIAITAIGLASPLAGPTTLGPGGLVGRK
jgi:5'-nucleotidase